MLASTRVHHSQTNTNVPSCAGSPPMRTHVDHEGVGPSRTNNWNQPGGQMCAFGGAVMVHVLPAQLNEGNKMRWFILFPCVLETASTDIIYLYK